MKWRALASPFNDVQVWGAYRGQWNYVIGFNSSTRKWSATAKLTHNIGGRIDLGFSFASREQAEEACIKHSREQLQ